ncbi:hypothetical protein EWF20_10860 [Sulfolobus sp. S-194]|uniref:hypothetical protein n=1 Tax=Sulfolobus sp. S-194 TaxID=2512240 RepID=UPI0014371ED8|nr:hypothetical protein [Sulfolobus sp. S-194]QIW24582.1 hypothetical protein EWF20_10860 [Sulfolobus sp. S-194]
MKKAIYALLIVLILPIFSIIPLASNNPTIHVYYTRYDSVYSSGGVKSFFLNSNSILYTVTSVIYNNTISGNNQALHATYNKTVYLLTFNSLTSYSGEVKVSMYINNSLSLYTNVPNLIRIIIYSAGQSELVWAGVENSSIAINTLAYVNGTGTLLLQFANGTSIVNVTLSIKTNTTLTKNISLSLLSMGFTISSTTSGEISIQTQIPKRYSPLFMSVNYNGTSWNNESGYIVTEAYFNGSLTPALLWKGMGYGFAGGLMGGGKLQFSEETIEFYGVNGTVVGYVHMVNVNGTNSFSLGPIKHSANFEFSEIKIVEVQGITVIHGEFIGKAYLNGNEIIIVANSHGKVSSTAYVNFSHVVSVNNEAGVLVLVYLNNSAKFVVVTKSNVTANVTTVKPENVSNTTVRIQGKAYVAQEVIVNSSSQYILFNVSLLTNNSEVTVYKLVNGEFIELNSSNYFIVNGKVIVFDDPSTTYYVVYNQQPSTVTTTTSTTTSQTPSMATTSQLIPPPSTTTSSSTSTALIVGIIIAVILVIIGLVLVLRRR